MKIRKLSIVNFLLYLILAPVMIMSGISLSYYFAILIIFVIMDVTSYTNGMNKGVDICFDVYDKKKG